MARYGTELRRKRRGNQLLPAIVGGIGEGLKGLAQGLNQRRQNQMDQQRLQLQQQQQQENERQNREAEAYRQKVLAQEEAKTSRELAATATERANRRSAVAGLSTYLEKERGNLTPEQAKRARQVIDTYGTYVPTEKLAEKFFEALAPEKKSGESGGGGISEAEARQQTNKIIDLEQESIERKVKPIEARKKREMDKKTAEKTKFMSDYKNYTVFDEDDNPIPDKTAAKKLEMEQQFDAEIADIDMRYTDEISRLWQPFEQRSAAGGFEALSDTVKQNIKRQPTGIPRLDDAMTTLDEEPTDEDLAPALSSQPSDIGLGTAVSRSPMKPSGAFNAKIQPDTTATTTSTSPVDDTALAKMSPEEAADLPEDQFNRWVELKRAKK